MAIDSKASTAPEQTAPERAEKFYMENTLLRVSGALFCHDAKLASTRAKKIELNRGDPDKRIVIEPHPNYGQPGPLAHKIFVALIQKARDHESYRSEGMGRTRQSPTVPRARRDSHHLRSSFFQKSKRSLLRD